MNDRTRASHRRTDPQQHFKKIGKWRLKIIGKPRKIPTKDGALPTLKKDRLLEAKEHRPELF
jgi:hypothetical protein